MMRTAAKALVARVEFATSLVSSRLGLNILEVDPKGQVVRTRSCDGWPLFVQQR